MTEAMLTQRTAAERREARRFLSVSLPSTLPAAIVFYAVPTLLALLLLNLPSATDYIGADNDDAMRLVQVRDLMAGQGWFDLMQYRLGPGGTLMHWSRLVDLPIANLIFVFDLFVSRARAEALAATVWPLGLAVSLLTAMGLAGKWTGGAAAMHAALGLTALFLITGNRFLPGALDHHNVQLVLMAVLLALLLDRRWSGSSLGAAGVAAGLAVAVGAETMLQVATACLLVAGIWGWHGAARAKGARAFCVGLTATVSLAFFATVAPQLYGAVVCDSLSLGFYAPIAAGGAGLMAATWLPQRCGLAGRCVALGLVGLTTVATTILIAPQCLGNPLGRLDPLVANLWLGAVAEARSVFTVAHLDPVPWGAFYGVGLVALAIALFSALRGRRTEASIVLATMIATSWLVAAFQVRGAIFVNLLSILPFALLLVDLRRLMLARPEDWQAKCLYLATGLAALPSAWALAGLVAVEGRAGIAARLAPPVVWSFSPSCHAPQALAALAAMPSAMVAAPVDLGVPILRFTSHKVLAAPYHRNEGGILTELYIGLSKPAQAEAFLRGAHVDILAFCRSDAETRDFARLEPQGLYAELLRGKPPDYLQPVPSTQNAALQLFRLRAP